MNRSMEDYFQESPLEVKDMILYPILLMSVEDDRDETFLSLAQANVFFFVLSLAKRC